MEMIDNSESYSYLLGIEACTRVCNLLLILTPTSRDRGSVPFVCPPHAGRVNKNLVSVLEPVPNANPRNLTYWYAIVSSISIPGIS